MNLILIGVGIFAFLHGIRDILQYMGKKNFLTTFLHFNDNPEGEIPSAIASFIIAAIFLYPGLI
jgi:hypothetical protein